MTHFIMDKNNHLINLSDICMTEYDDKKHCFKVTLKDNIEYEVEKLPYNLPYKICDIDRASKVVII